MLLFIQTLLNPNRDHAFPISSLLSFGSGLSVLGRLTHIDYTRIFGSACLGDVTANRETRIAELLSLLDVVAPGHWHVIHNPARAQSRSLRWIYKYTLPCAYSVITSDSKCLEMCIMWITWPTNMGCSHNGAFQFIHILNVKNPDLISVTPFHKTCLCTAWSMLCLFVQVQHVTPPVDNFNRVSKGCGAQSRALIKGAEPKKKNVCPTNQDLIRLHSRDDTHQWCW